VEAGGEVMAFPSPVDGKVLEIQAAAGMMVVTDETVAIIEDEDFRVDGDEGLE
jgi:multidrug efflux pump subunit AcrA (membrane-fusion protein)